LALISVSYLAVSAYAGFHANAQAAPQAAKQSASELPAVEVDEPVRKPRRRRTAKPAARSEMTVTRRQPAPPVQNEKPILPPDTQDARTGTVGVYSNSTAVATKTNTPLINIPQSLSVITHEFIRDQNPQNLTDVTRYVPGVDVHQGEGNRDELVIRGVNSSANFFVNGFRDDVQYYRDVYNSHSVEVLKGPNAITFGRGSGGGLVNRTLKEADGTRIYETTAQTASFWDRRFTLDAGQAVSENFAARLNAMYEGSDTFRDFVKFERYGINPTFTWKADEATTVKFSYEYFHDDRTADRGNPSQAVSGPGTARPFAPNGNLSTFFGSPSLNDARVNVQSVMASIDHDFQNGLTVKNSTRYADYQKFYQNVYPGSAVNISGTSVDLSAYNHTTDRQNLFNQTDFVYKAYTGPFFHTFGFGTEFGRQTGNNVRNTGFFGGARNIAVDPFNPTYFGPVTFTHLATDSNGSYRLLTESAYARDTVDLTRWLQLTGGARFDRFDLSALDMNTGINRTRIDNLVSPQAAVIVKPMDNLSLYSAYSVSYLPSSGDQFSSLSPGTAILEPQKFENKEVGIKWNPLKNLQYTAAVYELTRTNVPIADPNNPGFFFPSGSHLIRGFETALTGYITDRWQTSFGYAYTDARITSATSATVVPGNRVQLVPYNQFAWWNRYQINPIFAASLAVIYFSNSYASSDNNVELPSWARVDAGLYMQINETWKAHFNIENIFNQGYWASADGNNNLSPGQPRTFKLMVSARF
jgi:catecholate siderophore receptor